MPPLPRILRPAAAGLDPRDRSGLRSACRAHQLMGRVLAASTTATDQRLVALPTHLAVGAGQDWALVGWDRIERGQWSAEDSLLSFESLSPEDGSTRRHRHQLTEGRRFPRVFKDRVDSSIAFQRYLPIPGHRSGLTVSARRDLVTGVLDWRTTLGRGVRATDPGVESLSRESLARYRAEYDI